jgi:hypothetical protein
VAVSKACKRLHFDFATHIYRGIKMRKLQRAALAAALGMVIGTAANAESRIERGRYLMQSIVACGNCHTPQGPNGPLPGMELAGGLKVVDEKPFTAIASNITPDRETGIGKWTDAQIITAIREGKLIDASAMLGRPFTILGQIVSGDGRGHGLGFPTANLATEDECLPPDGVYAGRACLADGTFHLAAINLGTGPTFERHKRKIEAHLPAFTGNLSGQEIDLEFHRFIRGEKKFPNATALAEQIRQDVASILQGT